MSRPGHAETPTPQRPASSRAPGKRKPDSGSLDALIADALRTAHNRATPRARVAIFRLMDLASKLPTIEPDVLDRALSAADSPGFLWRLADGLSAPATDPTSQHNAAARRGAELRARILSSDGGTLTPEEAAHHLGLRSRQAVYTQIGQRRLLAVPSGSRKHLIPAWQFRHGRIVHGLDQVLAVLPDADPWWNLLFFVSDNGGLGHRRPLDVLLAGDVDSVVRAARAHGEGGQ